MMELEELLESWVADIIASALGVALIAFALEIKSENNFWWIALFAGIIMQIPTFYFQIWKFIEERI